ncbi:MAG TPA: C-type lectin domain-containing protein [Kofleriaceae bacterium]
MRAWCLVVVPAIGCAQLFGIDETTGPKAGIDSGVAIDARRDAPPSIDAAICEGGDARATDPMTGACYTYFAQPLGRTEARERCGSLGGGTMLATVQTAGENQLILSLIGMSTAFLGGNDELVEGSFKWDDGTDVVLANWNMGEPNNGTGLFEEDCIVIHGMFAGKWDDRPCASSPNIAGAYPFVCERD